MALSARNKHDDLTPEEIAALVAQAQALFRPDPHRVLNAALDYSKRGLLVIPIPLAGTDRNAGKRPLLNGWPQLRLTTPALVRQYFLTTTCLNIGVILGHAAGGLVDVDLDCPE